MPHLKSFALASLLALTLGGGMLLAVPTASADPPEGNTIGKSTSNPDGGGVDKPYDVSDDLTAGSQGAGLDGNNGCGQEKKAGQAPDPVFGIDDNNGHCGKPGSEGVPD
jgi:hypothetical protein